MLLLPFKKNYIFTGIILLLIVNGSLVWASERATPDSTRMIVPKSALIRSAIVPGWGQLYVHKPVKAAIYFSLESYHLYNFFKYNDIYQYVKETKNSLGVEAWNALSENEKKEQIKAITGYNLTLDSGRPRDMRNKYAWWCAGFYIAGMLDALVDAHLYYFPGDNIELMVNPETTGVGISFSWNIGRQYGY